MQIEKDFKITAGVLLALAVAFGGVSWWPRSQERADLESRVESAKKQLGVDRKGSQGLGELRDHVADLRRQSQDTHKVVPTSNDLADLLRRINSELVAFGMKNQEVQTEVVVSGADFNVIPLRLRFEGDFEGLFGFVKNIESMSRLTRITKLDVAGVPTKPGEPLLVRLELATFSTASEGEAR